ncbi:MAG TPA: transporter substrate-binding domain-containing protein [Thermodesulfobacteriota bacterium]|nr:transporter substrate-binding domain-containing protein [Thermodesulfobacteriota bacterium]
MHMLKLFLTLIFIALIGCKIPQDPEGTLKRVQGGTMRVGVSDNEPWVIKGPNGEPSGVEVELVRQFAKELNAKVEWDWGSVEEHMEALKHYELDLVIGGITEATPWKKEVGMTRPYFTSRIVVGVSPSATLPQDIEGKKVIVPQSGAVAAYVKDAGGIPVRIKDPSQVNGLMAAPEWQLKRLGLTPSKIELHQDKHVMAVPNGENAWVMRLEEFLHSHGSQITKRLKQQETME